MQACKNVYSASMYSLQLRSFANPIMWLVLSENYSNIYKCSWERFSSRAIFLRIPSIWYDSGFKLRIWPFAYLSMRPRQEESSIFIWSNKAIFSSFVKFTLFLIRFSSNYSKVNSSEEFKARISYRKMLWTLFHSLIMSSVTRAVNFKAKWPALLSSVWVLMPSIMKSCIS